MSISMPLTYQQIATNDIKRSMNSLKIKQQRFSLSLKTYRNGIYTITNFHFHQNVICYFPIHMFYLYWHNNTHKNACKYYTYRYLC